MNCLRYNVTLGWFTVQHQRISNPAASTIVLYSPLLIRFGYAKDDAKLWIYCDENESVSIFPQAMEPIKIFMANSKSHRKTIFHAKFPPRPRKRKPNATLDWFEFWALRSRTAEAISTIFLWAKNYVRLRFWESIYFRHFIANACVFRMYFRLIKIFGMSWFENGGKNMPINEHS